MAGFGYALVKCFGDSLVVQTTDREMAELAAHEALRMAPKAKVQVRSMLTKRSYDLGKPTEASAFVQAQRDGGWSVSAGGMQDLEGAIILWLLTTLREQGWELFTVTGDPGGYAVTHFTYHLQRR